MDKGKEAQVHCLSGSESKSGSNSSDEKSEKVKLPAKRPRDTQKKSTGVASIAKGRFTAKAWEHFERHEDKENDIVTAECLYCHKVYQAHPIRNGTGAMNKHMKKCKNHPDRKLEETQQSNLFVKKGQDGAASVSNWSFKPEEVRKAIVRMIIIDELPYSFVEKEGFRGLMEAICPNYKIPNRTTIARYCDELYANEKATLKSVISSPDVRVSLTTDTWTSIQRINYMCTTAHFIDDGWNLHKRIISFKPITSHTGEDIGRCIQQVLRDWDIHSVMSITVDNATANDLAIEYLKDRVSNNLVSNGDYLHMRCTAHILNLVVKDGLKKYEGPIDKIRAAVKYIRNSPSRLARFNACVAEKNIQSKTGLHYDCPTRWNSTCDMLETASLLSEAFEEYELKDRHYKTDLGEKVPKRGDWKIVKKLISLLQLFKRKTEKVSGTSYVTASFFVSEIVDLNVKLLKLKDDEEEEFRKMGKEMRKKYNKYWDNVKKLNMAMYFATILDPRMKVEIVKYGFKRIYNMEKEPDADPTDVAKEIDDAVKVVTKDFEKLFFQYVSMYEKPMPSDQSHFPSNFEKYPDDEDDLIEFHREFIIDGGTSASETKTELQKYLLEPREPGLDSNEFDLLKWWKVNSIRFPILAHMAKDILAIPISTVASESAFSTSGRILDSFRSSLSTQHVQALVCTQDWIRKSRKHIDMDDFVVLDEYDAIAKDIPDIVEEL